MSFVVTIDKSILGIKAPFSIFIEMGLFLIVINSL